MKLKQYIPNSLSIIRLVLITLLLRLLLSDFNSVTHNDIFLLITELTLLIYCSDFLDGKLARTFKCCSKCGAYLDVTADFYYILSQSTILIKYRIIPPYIVFCIVLEFFIFLFSSRYITKIQTVALSTI